MHRMYQRMPDIRTGSTIGPTRQTTTKLHHIQQPRLVEAYQWSTPGNLTRSAFLSYAITIKASIPKLLPCMEILFAPQPVRPNSSRTVEEWFKTTFDPFDQEPWRERNRRCSSAPCGAERIRRPLSTRAMSSSFTRSERGFTEKSPSTPRGETVSIDKREYRSAAQSHGVHWHRTSPIPERFESAANAIIDRERDSSPMTYEEARSHSNFAKNNVDYVEADISHHYYKHGMIPDTNHPSGVLAFQQEFDRTCVPNDPTMPTKLSQPRPDWTWGVDEKSLTEYQQYSRRQTYAKYVLEKITRPQNQTIMPGFVWELKSGAAGGTIYHAENQCIGAGATMVNALRLFFDAAKKHGAIPHEDGDLLAFSVATDGQFAHLCLHWFDFPDHHGTRIKSYALCEPDRIPEFFQRCKNIIDFVCSGRNGKVQSALDALFRKTVVENLTLRQPIDDIFQARRDRMIASYYRDHPSFATPSTSMSGHANSGSASPHPESCTTKATYSHTEIPSSPAAMATARQLNPLKRPSAQSCPAGSEDKKRPKYDEDVRHRY